MKLLFPGRKLYVAIDQEGGQVDRLKKIFAKDKLLKEASYYGAIAEYDLVQAKRELYRDSKFTAEILADLGFDINLAPMVDLTFFKNSSVKGVKKSWAATEARSYSSEVRIVVELATVFIKAMHEVGIITVVKHIPGLGRAFEDSHNGEAIIEAGYLDLLEKDFLVFKALSFDLYFSRVINSSCIPFLTAVLRVSFWLNVFSRSIPNSSPRMIPIEFNPKILQAAAVAAI